MGLSLDLFALAAISTYSLVGWVIGVRLLRLARRTRGFPETALGAGECLLAGLVPPLFIVAQAASEKAASEAKRTRIRDPCERVEARSYDAGARRASI